MKGNSFHINKTQFAFVEFDAQTKKLQKSIDCYMGLEESLIFCQDVLSGKIPKKAAAEKAKGEQYPKPVWSSPLGGVNEQKARERKLRTDGKAVSRSFNSLDVIPNTPVKWYRRCLFADDEEKVMLIDAGPFYSYFKHKNRNTSPFVYLSNLISDKKETDALKKFVAGVHRKNAACNAEMRTVLQGFQDYARNVQSYGVFDTEDRHFGNCLECGQDFHTDEVLKYKCRQICPHCGRYLTMFTHRTVPRFSVEYGVQYIDRDVNQELAVRHFLVTKYFKPNGSEVSYFEYERDRFKKNSFGYSFYYQVSRWNSRAETMLWRDSKPYQGYMWSMRNIFYEDEYLYSKTQYEDECAVTAQESAESVMIGLNNSFLQETLNACPSDTLKVQYDGALSPVLFRSKSEQAEIVQAIVPMRLAAE